MRTDYIRHSFQAALYTRHFGKQAVEVFRGGFGNLFQRDAAEPGEKFGGVAHISRFVGLAAMGNGGEIGRIGFHQQAVGRAVLGSSLNIGGIFEGENARKREIAAQIQRGFGKGGVFGEAVDNGFFCAVFTQQAQGVGGCFAGVDDKRQAALFGGGNVDGETAVLPFQIAAAPVIIQSGFADAGNFRVGGMLHQFGGGEFGGGFAVGVDADGGVDMRMGFGDGEHLGEAVAADADGESLGDLVLRHVGKYLRQAVCQAFHIEVAVGVYKLHGLGYGKFFRLPQCGSGSLKTGLHYMV